MKKIKISELPICTTLKGLFTIGTDNQNRSVKVSLQFVEDKTNEAVANAETATKNAQAATEETKKATSAANTAAQKASESSAAADKSKAAADKATEEALKATQNAEKATEAANTATEAAKNATTSANEATEASKKATADTIKATTDAQAATAETLAKIAVLVPSGLSVECISHITWGNKTRIPIKAVLSPVTAMKNVIYLSDNRAVEVSIDGFITAVSKGMSRVNVIPTMNTALAKTFLIRVEEPTSRLTLSSQLRFTQAGGFRLT